MHNKHRKGFDDRLRIITRRLAHDSLDDSMTRYLIQIPRDSLSEASKAAIARTISEVHTEIVLTNPDAVQIAITEIDAGCFFAGGSLLECDHIFVHGYLPDDDRTRQLKERALNAAGRGRHSCRRLRTGFDLGVHNPGPGVRIGGMFWRRRME